MKVSEILENIESPVFSIEILPPLKGNSIQNVYKIIDKLVEFAPKFINITTHHSEIIYKELPDGGFKKLDVRKRPGSVAIAAAIQNKYNITTVPHMICKGFSREETEYALIDLDFLGVHNLLLLRGDANKLEADQIATNRNENASDLQIQIAQYNDGIDVNNDFFEKPSTPFSYGMACYPEKHEESPNMEYELFYMKKKAELGAAYFVTQMFYDNQKYFDFVDLCRREGITQPIIPGLKPITMCRHLNLLPKVFHTTLPVPLAEALKNCKDNEEAKEVGVEWAIHQSKELIAAGVSSIHYYSLIASDSIRRIVKEVF